MFIGSAPIEASSTNETASCLSGNCQETLLTYDGYARLQTKHVPEQNAGTATTYTYNADDTVLTVTDGRGASATYSYVGNNRHLVTGITYSASGGISIPAAVGLGYDAAGNRTSMTDGTGSTSYNYDQLSRMSSETHTITGLGANTISYQYNLANQLTSITNPLNVTTTYLHDQAGRLSSVSGSGLAGAIPYASNFRYRAWGAAKHVEYGDGRTLDATYNNRLQAATFQIPGLMSKTYDYHADNRLRFSSDLLDHRFDRSYSFDHGGRINGALSGAEARGEGATQDRPYWQTYGYDAMGHLTARTTYQWNSPQLSSSDSYTNNRHDPVGALWQYDPDGNLLGSPGNSYTYDAAGRVDTVWSGSSSVLGLDGDGLQVRSAETVYDPQTQTETATTKYYVRSTVLGGEVLTEIEPAAVYSRSFVYAGGAVMATQERWFAQTEEISWEHRDPSNASFRMTVLGTSAMQSSELDPVGADAGLTNGASQSIPDEGSLAPYGSFSSASNLFSTYSWDGIRMPVDEFFQVVNGLMHGRFGTMESSARASAPKLIGYSVSRFHGRLIRDFGLNLDRAYNEALEEGNLTRNWLVDSNWDFDPNWFPQKPTPGFTWGSVATFDAGKFVKCLKAFHVTNANFTGTRSGGGFTGEHKGKKFSVNFDVTRYTKEGIRKYVVAHGGRRGSAPSVGMAIRGRPDVYVASDLANDADVPDISVIAVEVHELGNKLAQLFFNDRNRPRAIHPFIRRWDPDSGMALEECVFNGVVAQNTGHVGVPKK